MRGGGNGSVRRKRKVEEVEGKEVKRKRITRNIIIFFKEPHK